MVCEGDFSVNKEDVDFLLGGVIIVGGINIVDEDGFGEIEFMGDGLFLSLGWWGGEVGGDSDNCERVVFEFGCGEDVESDEWEFLSLRFLFSYICGIDLRC